MTVLVASSCALEAVSVSKTRLEERQERKEGESWSQREQVESQINAYTK